MTLNRSCGWDHMLSPVANFGVYNDDERSLMKGKESHNQEKVDVDGRGRGRGRPDLGRRRSLGVGCGVWGTAKAAVSAWKKQSAAPERHRSGHLQAPRQTEPTAKFPLLSRELYIWSLDRGCTSGQAPIATWQPRKSLQSCGWEKPLVVLN